MIARFVLGAGAIFAVAGLAGCGAEQGSEGVGESTAALHGTTGTPSVAASNTATDMPASMSRQFAGTCVINDNGIEKLLVAGGFDPSGTALSSILAYDAAGNTWTNLSTGVGAISLTNARGYVKGIQVPGDSTKCLFIAGAPNLTGASAVTDVDLVDANGAGAFLKSAQKPLQQGRSKFQVSTCNDKVIVFGGIDEGTNPDTVRNTIEVSANSTASGATAWSLHSTSGTDAFTTSRYDFGLAKDPNAGASAAEFIVAAGNNGAGPLDTVEVVTTATSAGVTCGSVSVKVAKLANNSTYHMTNAVEGNVAFPEGTTNHFILAAGFAGGLTPLPTATDDLTVSNWGTPTVSSAAGASLSVGTHLPVLVGPIDDPNFTPAYMLIGGDDDATYATADNIAAANSVQEYQSSYNFRTATLNAGNARAVGGYLNSFVYLASGGPLASGTLTANLEVEKITP